MANDQIQKFQPQMVDAVLTRVTEMEKAGGINIPPNYSPANALRSAYLILQDQKDMDGKPVLQTCSPASIQNSMFNMVVDGLNPAKKQCAFIPRGGKLVYQREYSGSMTLAKRYGTLREDPKGGVIYEGDVFEYAIDPTTGRKKIVKHEQKFENIDDSKIKGAYAIGIFEDGSSDMDIMTMAQIRKSWEQGPSKGNSPAHKNFTGEMVKKTVINRFCKLIIAASDDSVLNETEQGERTPYTPPTAANSGPVITIEPEPIQEAVEVPSEPETEPAPTPPTSKKDKNAKQPEF